MTWAVRFVKQILDRLRQAAFPAEPHHRKIIHFSKIGYHSFYTEQYFRIERSTVRGKGQAATQQLVGHYTQVSH